MWSYYGRKWSIVSKYPAPEFNTIIEPFAGTASYSYKHWEKNIILLDKYDVIVRIWNYLKQASPQNILSLPDVENGECIKNKYNQLLPEERWLIGFCINNASTTPKHTAGRMNFNSWNRDKIRIAKDLYKIRHWEVYLADYTEINNRESTWYIDPPYQCQKRYKNNSINYKALAQWCKTRMGHVIVCENSKADWMDFKPLVELSGQRTRTLEVMWTNKQEE